LRFWCITLARDALDAVADHGAAVTVDGAFDHPLIVVDKQTGGDEVWFVLFHAVELDRPCNSIGRTTPELPLIIYRGTIRTQVDLGWECTQVDQRCGVEVIAMVRKVGDPSKTLNFVRHIFLLSAVSVWEGRFPVNHASLKVEMGKKGAGIE